MGFVSKLLQKSLNPVGPTPSATNAGILKNVGLDLNTVLTPKGKRKKTAGLQGKDPDEILVTTLGG